MLGRSGKSIAELAARGSQAAVSAVRRDGIVGREPSPDTVFKEGDVVVVCGTPEAVEHAETLAPDGVKTTLLRPPHARIVGTLFKGKPAERWGRKTTGLRGFCQEA